MYRGVLGAGVLCTLELQAEVRRVNLRILAGDKIDDNLWISRVKVVKVVQ